MTERRLRRPSPLAAFAATAAIFLAAFDGISWQARAGRTTPAASRPVPQQVVHRRIQRRVIVTTVVRRVVDPAAPAAAPRTVSTTMSAAPVVSAPAPAVSAPAPAPVVTRAS